MRIIVAEVIYSIAAYDSDTPDVVAGNLIGSSKQIVQPGDVLLSRIVPHIRRAWVVGKSKGRRIIASGEWIVFRNERADPAYLRRALMSDEFHTHFMATVAGVGGSLMRARPAYVAKIKIPLPSLAEQKRIAAILDQADAVRRKRQHALQLADDFLRATFLDMFGDPVRNPKKWPQLRIDQFVTIVRGSSPRPKSDPRYYGGTVPRLMVADITRDGWFVTPRIDTLTEVGATFSRPVPAGTVVMAVSGEVGVMGQLQVNACIHDGFVGFMNLQKQTVLPIYLRLFAFFSG